MSKVGMFYQINCDNTKVILNLALIKFVLKKEDKICVYYFESKIPDVTFDYNENNWKLLCDALDAYCNGGKK